MQIMGQLRELVFRLPEKLLLLENLSLEVKFVTGIYFVRFQVLTAVSMKSRALWDVAPCSLGVD
jgi:hypothetical protein